LKNGPKLGGGLFGLMYNQCLIVLGYELEKSEEKLSFKKMQVSTWDRISNLIK
jgi:hypothetical protein